MSGFTSVVFDLDGTLVDSSHDIAAALNSVLSPRGGSPLTAAQVDPLLGEGVRQLVVEAVREAGIADPDLVVSDVAKEYIAAYQKRPVVDSVLYDGVEDALRALAERNVPMAVCTNKNEAVARLVLAGLGVAGYFPVVVGGDRLENCKPHPDHLLLAFTELGTHGPDGILVGDSPIDQQCATNAGVGFRAVAWAPTAVTGTRLDTFSDLLHQVADQSTISSATSHKGEKS